MEFKFLSKEEYMERIGEIIELFNVCFNKKISQEFLKWRYIDNPIDDFLVYVAIDNGKIIANYSVSPVVVLIDNKIEKVALSMTTMTHPMYAGKGIFTQLANGVYKKMEDLKYKAVIGFPNVNSHMAFVKKLKWKDIYEIPTIRLNLESAKVIGESDICLERDDEFLLDYSEILRNDKINYYFNKDSLNWRFRDNPINKYENYVVSKEGKVIACLIIKKFNSKEIDIVFMKSLDNDYLKLALNSLIIKMKVNNFEFINTWCSIHSNKHAVLEKIGFINGSPITYFGARDFKENDSLIYNYYNWNIDMGVSDVY